MVEKAQPITREGLVKIEEELRHLETVRRQEVADNARLTREILSGDSTVASGPARPDVTDSSDPAPNRGAGSAPAVLGCETGLTSLEVRPN